MPPSREGAGKTGCPPHPQPRVQLKKHTSVFATGRGGIIRPSLRNGFNGLLRALPGDRALLPPSSARRGTRLRQLDASVGASEPHGFAVREPRASSCALPRPSHPAPNVRDDRDPPLLGARDGAGDSSDFSSKGSEISLRATLDKGSQEQPVGQISRTIDPG